MSSTPAQRAANWDALASCGRPHVWELIDVGAPYPVARCVHCGGRVHRRYATAYDDGRRAERAEAEGRHRELTARYRELTERFEELSGRLAVEAEAAA